MPILAGNPASAAEAVLFIFGIVVATALWVFADAKRHAKAGNAVVFSASSFELGTPASWFVACLLLWELFFPLYVKSRGAAF